MQYNNERIEAYKKAKSLTELRAGRTKVKGEGMIVYFRLKRTDGKEWNLREEDFLKDVFQTLEVPILVRSLVKNSIIKSKEYKDLKAFVLKNNFVYL